MDARSLQVRKPNSLAILLIAVIAISTLRIRSAIDRLPPDPGLDFFSEARQEGFRVLFREEGGYLDLPRRIISLAISRLSPEWWVIASNVIWLALVAGASAVIFRLILEVTSSRLAAFVAGVTYSLSPAASESQIGHDSVVKWVLLLSSILVFSHPRTTRKLSMKTFALLVLSGVSNPLSFVLFVPLVTANFSRIDHKRTIPLVYAGVLLLLSSLQFVAWRFSGQGVQKYASDTTYAPWSGMGGFWIFNWLSGPVFAGVILALDALAVLKRRSSLLGELAHFRISLCLSSIGLWLTSYLLGGIGDRYFVVPQTLAWIAAIALIYEHWGKRYTLTFVAAVLTVCMMFAGSLRWFSASTFLTASPKWSSDVKIARQKCSEEEIEFWIISQSINEIEFRCELLR